jgi:hypothetical protein
MLHLFKKAKRKLNPMLLNVLIISLLVHLGALIILGGITIVKFVIPDEAQFEEPPAAQEEQPPPETKVKIKPEAAPEKQPLDNLRMKQIGNIAVPDVGDLPGMEDSFTVSDGLGGFSGGGVLGGAAGRIGIGMSDISVFGLKSRAERVLFVIDASDGMLIDKKGGLHSYRVIKGEIVTMVENLSAGTLFNVVFYRGKDLLFFKPQPVPAGDAVAKELKRWAAPINANYNDRRLHGASMKELSALPGSPIHKALEQDIRRPPDVGNEFIYLTQIILEQSIDAAFVITGQMPGIGTIRRNPTPEEAAKWQQVVQTPEYQQKSRVWEAARQRALAIARNKLRALNAQRAKQGLPPKVLGDALVPAMGVRIAAEHPGIPPKYYIGERQVESYLKELKDVLYENKGGKAPSINVVMFLAEDENFNDQMKDRVNDYVRSFSGKYRIVRGLKQIRSAASAAETKN